MTDQERQELSGRLYALEFLVVALLDERIRQLPDNGKDTEHLEAFVQKLQNQFLANSTTMSTVARTVAEQKILKLLEGGLSVYWNK